MWALLFIGIAGGFVAWLERQRRRSFWQTSFVKIGEDTYKSGPTSLRKTNGDWIVSIQTAARDDDPPSLKAARITPRVRRLPGLSIVNGVVSFKPGQLQPKRVEALAKQVIEDFDVRDPSAALTRNYLAEIDAEARLAIVNAATDADLLVQAANDADERVRTTANAKLTPERLAANINGGVHRAKETALAVLSQDRAAAERVSALIVDPTMVARLARAALLTSELPRLRAWACDPSLFHRESAAAIAAIDADREAFFLALLALPHEEAQILALDHLAAIGTPASSDAILSRTTSDSFAVRTAAKQALETLAARTPDTLAGAVAVADALSGAVSTK